MRTHTWMVSITAAGLGLASCSEVTPPDSRQEARNRWSEMRGQLKYQLAAESFAKGQIDQAQEHLAEAIGLDPRGPDAYVLMTRILLERGETASAAEALQEAMHHGGNTAETDYLNGLIAQRYARFTDALAWYQRASEREPMNAHYVVATAETLVSLNRVADALALVRDRWTDLEQNATLRSLAGEIYTMLGRYEDAADAYREAVLIAPDDRMLQLQLGLALTFSQSYEEGRTVLSAAIAATEDDPPSVLTALGRCHLALGEYADAKAVMRRVVEADPDHGRGWSLLGQAALASGDLLTARRAATRALHIDPDSADHAMLLAYVCWRQRDYAAAVTSLEAVQRHVPDDLMALYLLGQCHQATGDTRAAEDCCRRALRADPQCDWAQQFLENGSAAGRRREAVSDHHEHVR